MDASKGIISSVSMPVWPLYVGERELVVLFQDERALCVLGPGKHRRGGSIPMFGRKSVVGFSQERLPVPYVVRGIELLDHARVDVDMQCTLRCTSDVDLLLAAVREYTPENLAMELNASLEHEFERLARLAVQGMEHSTFTSLIDLNERMFRHAKPESILGGLVQIVAIPKGRPVPDPQWEKLVDIEAGGAIKIKTEEIEDNIQDERERRKARRRLMVQTLDDNYLMQLARAIGVPYWYLKYPDQYGENLERHAGLIRSMLENAGEVSRLASSMAMNAPQLRELLGGVVPTGQAAAELTGGSTGPVTGKLNFDHVLDEILADLNCTEMVNGSSAYLGDRDGVREGDAVIVSLDPANLQQHRSELMTRFENHHGLTKSFWKFIPYDDDLTAVIEAFWGATLPSRALTSVAMRVASVSEHGRDLHVAVDVRGASFENMKKYLLQRKNLNLIQGLLPYRRVIYQARQ